MLRIALVVLPLILACAGCGGGGGGGGSAAPPKPSVSVVIDPLALLPGEAATATITFSSDVTGFVAGDVTVAGGTMGAFTPVDGKTYTVAVTAGAVGTNVLDVDIAAGVCADAAGTGNAAGEGHAAIAYAPWGTTPARDSYGVYTDLTITHNSITATQRFRLMSPGTFMMGSPSDEAGRIDERENLHQVTLTSPYWLADSECTQRLWQAVMNANPSTVTTDDLAPLTDATRGDMETFLVSLNGLATNLQARLPTDAEWEYAARAGTTTPFGIPTVDATTVITTPDPSDPYITTGTTPAHPVRVKTASVNTWGLWEMHGNVGEVCSDWYVASLGTSASVDPTGPATGTYSVMRSGAYSGRGRSSRSAMRSGYYLTFATPSGGFRFAAPNAPSGSG